MLRPKRPLVAERMLRPTTPTRRGGVRVIPCPTPAYPGAFIGSFADWKRSPHWRRTNSKGTLRRSEGNQHPSGRLLPDLNHPCHRRGCRVFSGCFWALLQVLHLRNTLAVSGAVRRRRVAQTAAAGGREIGFRPGRTGGGGEQFVVSGVAAGTVGVFQAIRDCAGEGPAGFSGEW